MNTFKGPLDSHHKNLNSIFSRRIKYNKYAVHLSFVASILLSSFTLSSCGTTLPSTGIMGHQYISLISKPSPAIVKSPPNRKSYALPNIMYGILGGKKKEKQSTPIQFVGPLKPYKDKSKLMLKKKVIQGDHPVAPFVPNVADILK